MSDKGKHFIAIWFWIGLLLFAYGLLIGGVGIYYLFVPMPDPPVLAHLHMGIWWGVALTALGAFYLVKFRPQ